MRPSRTAISTQARPRSFCGLVHIPCLSSVAACLAPPPPFTPGLAHSDIRHPTTVFVVASTCRVHGGDVLRGYPVASSAATAPAHPLPPDLVHSDIARGCPRAVGPRSPSPPASCETKSPTAVCNQRRCSHRQSHQTPSETTKVVVLVLSWLIRCNRQK